MIFILLSGKTIFLFPENMILFFRHKRKDDLSQKNAWKYDIFFKCPEKVVFLKNSCLNMIFFVISGKMVFLFFQKIWYVFFRSKMKEDDLYQKARGNIVFSVYMTMPHPGKKTKMPRKNTPKCDISGITEKDDIHPIFILDSFYFCWNTIFIDYLERAQEAAAGDVLQEIMFLEISQNSEGKTCVRASFFTKLQT